ncbi:MAG: glycosyltransferase family 2 protein [Nanoarchaeota archaeon]|nr:glycosyltransferase family 2 protein [Nanoarchaeota archaeon]
MIITYLDVVLYITYFILLFLSIFWIIVLFSSKEDKVERKLTNFPLFTVIVPAYNEEKSIQETLTSLINLDYPNDKLEIIVVNDGSKDKTESIVEELIKANPSKNICLINQKNQGKGNAMNKGLARAKGEYFACLDADSFVSSDAIKKMLPIFEEDKDVAAVCPLLKVKDPGTTLQKVQWCEYIINMFYKSLNSKINCIHVTPGPFSVYKTKVINDLGGYDEETITEDLEIAIRLQKHQYKIVQTFDTTVETIAPTSWKKLFWQRIRWYKGAVDNAIRYKSLMFNKKYGDFGMLRMPTVVSSGIIALILTGALVQSMFSKLFQQFMYLKDINFDFITLLKNYSFHFNFLSLPFFKIVIASTLMGISFFIMIYSYKLVKENITRYGRTWTSLITYLSVYGLFITFVWVYIAFMFISKKKNSWF